MNFTELSQFHYRYLDTYRVFSHSYVQYLFLIVVHTRTCNVCWV